MIEPAPVEGIDPVLIKLVIALLLGLFLGLEREWSNKSAGIRTFALISLLATVFAVIESELLLFAGALLIVSHAILLGVRSLLEEGDGGLSITTSVSMLVTYSIGVLIGNGLYTAGIAVAVFSSFLLILKRELHAFALGLSKEEMRSAAEFAILAFVIYPILPSESMGPWNAVQPQLVWLLVIAISGIGFVNYVLIKRYRKKGIAFTGFFGGLVNSTAVIAEMARRVKGQKNILGLAVAAILLANAAMALRNAVIVIAFVPEALLIVGAPLGAIVVVGIVGSFFVGDWSSEFEADLNSPFSLRNALLFGGMFLVVLLVSAGAEATFGSAGFVATSFFAGLVSSGTATTTAVTLASTGQITQETAAAGVLAGTAASILVKVGFAASIERSLIKPVLAWSLVIIATGVGVGLITTLLL